jgi:cytoskeletal protein RodZ
MERSIGAQLKQIRESQGIALETIALKTHISLDYLQALEADDIEALPSKVHVRGFLRLYANQLGVELDDLIVSGYHLADKKQPSTETVNAEMEQEDLAPMREAPEDLEVQEPSTEPAYEQDSEAVPSSPATIEPETSALLIESQESALIFKAIGEKIKNRRELLSLSITEIHNNLHISPQHLESIETGKFNQLPSPVQAKGMLVNYAEFLNLETDPLLSDFTDALQLQRIEKQRALSTRKRRSARELSPTALRLKNFFTLDLLVITVLFIAFALFVVWGVNRILASDPSELGENEIPGVSDVLLATDTPTPQIPADAEATIIMIEDEDEDPETEAGGGEEEPLFTPAASSDPINIILVPRQRLWVQVTVDGEIAFQGRVIPGNAYDFSGQEQIDVLTGNIGSLQILFNNQDIGSQGLLGQVAELSFTANGLVLPPPTSTPTITNTPQTTPTSTDTDD